MEIEFSSCKTCDAFKQLMANPTERKAIKNFNKFFNQAILKASIKVYQKLKSSENAHIYNSTTSGNNKIELVSGIKKKEPVVLKVRIQDSYRKFFNFYQSDTSGSKDFCTVQNWQGQFNDVSNIYVLEVNKHDYSKV